MKKAALFLVILPVIAVLACLPACQSPENSDQVDAAYYTRDESPDLNDPYGGFNLADEAPAFDDPLIAKEFSGAEETSYDDPMTTNDSVVNMESPDRGRLFLRITWGNLERDSTIDFATDFSGSLMVDRGAVLLKRLIRFDKGDRIIPRTRPNILEWISHTGPAFDGILVRVFPMPSTSAMHAANDTMRIVTFSTGPLTESFTLEELKDIHKVFPVDDAGNAVSFDAVYIMPHACPHGFLGGIWKNNPDTAGGFFRGKWISHNGALLGHMKGFYGVNKNGENVFFGKYIDLSGRFRGILRGHYGRLNADGPGVFSGIWMDSNLRICGGIMGIWKTSNKIDGGGFFRGMWKKHCR